MNAIKTACWMVNVTATRYLLQGAEKAGAFFLFLSTDFVFDGLGGPYSEDDAGESCELLRRQQT